MKILMDKAAWDGRERRNPVRVCGMRMKCLKERFYISKLRKRLLIYFCLVVFVSLSVGIQLIFEIGNNRLQAQIFESITAQLPQDAAAKLDMSQTTSALKRLQYRMILVMVIVLVCVLATMFVFIRNIVEPLDAMAKVTQKMADGHLGEPVPIRNQDEIGKIGELINDLAMNLQEVLLYVWNQSTHCVKSIESLSKKLNFLENSCLPKEISEEFEAVKTDIEEMKEMVQAFDFYNIALEEGKILATDKSTSAQTRANQFDTNQEKGD